MKNTDFMDRNSEAILQVVAALSAVLFIYLTLPSIAPLLFHDSGSLSQALWESPISAKEGLLLFSAIVFIGVALIIIIKIRNAIYLRHLGEIDTSILKWPLVFLAIKLIVSLAILLIIFVLIVTLLQQLGIDRTAAILMITTTGMISIFILQLFKH